jgi:UDP-N-acetylglucosamine diphosphorylase / glucose-1-phosphate thymidylyltransferase / UDP-N-acetylgalactosamine diphosphorylase / glucosamine-1-phosphate N-acetyltransferase / galactosamine-1-phosphate N-acetyltransferase
MIAKSILKIDTVFIPDKFSNASTLIQDSFPSLDVNEFCDNEDIFEKYIPTVGNQYSNYCLTIPIENHNNNFELPINSLIYNNANQTHSLCSNIAGNNHNYPQISVDDFVYPWDFLNVVKRVLVTEVTSTVISSKATVAQSSIINGPCLIEDDVIIDDFCKIVGPSYIGNGSSIGMGSLLRQPMMGNNISIGFNCEIAKTYFEGHDRIAYQNVILDSIIGRNVWFGGYSGTANVLLDRKNVRYQMHDKLVDTGTNHFGAVVGNNCAIGASVIILPGRQVQSNTVIQAGTIFGKTI